MPAHGRPVATPVSRLARGRGVVAGVLLACANAVLAQARPHVTVVGPPPPAAVAAPEAATTAPEVTAAPSPPPATRAPPAAVVPPPASCARPVIRPTRTGGGWHRVQYELERAYCGDAAPGKLHGALLTPGARRITQNHYAGALFTDLLVRGDGAAARAWLREQVEGEFQGSEQAGGYTNYYRADVLAGLRWASEHGDAEMARLATTWLQWSYALDLLHTVPGSYEVTVPCSRMKLYNRDGRVMSLRLLAGDADPSEALAAKRWQYPAYDDVRWLADALLSGRIRVDPAAADWAVRRSRPALDRVLGGLEGIRLRSPLRWVLLDSGAWYSYAPDGIADAASNPVDAVAATPEGDVRELWRDRARERVPVRVEGGRIVSRLSDGERAIELPAGRAVLTIDVGRR
jgi:hypothetical protein